MALLVAGFALCAANMAASRFVLSAQRHIDRFLAEAREQLAGFSPGAVKGEKAQEKVRAAVESRMEELSAFRRA